MNKYVVLSILIILAVLVSTEPKETKKYPDSHLKSFNTNRLNDIENPNMRFKISDTSRQKSPAKSITPKNSEEFLLMDSNLRMNSKNLVEDRYKNILKEWNGIIQN
tara:strand:+ start:621 stop:938 length:318 start_codon:yes stop_codon:yes gene_type:complete